MVTTIVRQTSDADPNQYHIDVPPRLLVGCMAASFDLLRLLPLHLRHMCNLQ